MDVTNMDEVVRNIDRRLEKVEQFLPRLATKEQLEDNRRHAQVLFESLQDGIRMVADGVSHLTAEVRELKFTVWPKIEDHDLRLLVLEAGRSPRPRRRR